METREQVKARLEQLQIFYKNTLLYVCTVIGSILLRVILDNDYFWPIWVILIGGGYLGARAVNLGLLPLMEEIFPFMRRSWAEEETQRRLTTKNNNKAPIKNASPAPAPGLENAAMPEKGAADQKATKKPSPIKK